MAQLRGVEAQGREGVTQLRGDEAQVVKKFQNFFFWSKIVLQDVHLQETLKNS